MNLEERSYLLWSVKLLTRPVGKSTLTKKTSHYILKRKSANLTPKKMNKKSEGSN